MVLQPGHPAGVSVLVSRVAGWHRGFGHQEQADTLRHGGIMLSDGSARLMSPSTISRSRTGSTTASARRVACTAISIMTSPFERHDQRPGCDRGQPEQLARKAVQRQERPARRVSHDLHQQHHRWGQPLWHQRVFCQIDFRRQSDREHCPDQNLGQIWHGLRTRPGECTENGDGLRIRLYNVRDSGYGNTLRYNRFEQIGYNGVDVFGPDTTLENN